MIADAARVRAFACSGGTNTADVQGLQRYVQGHLKTPSDNSSGQLARFFVQRSQAKLRNLHDLPEDWDGAGSAAPNADAIANAAARLPELYRIGAAHAQWREPHISANEDGEVSFEWWCGPRKITMYFGSSTIELIRVWGENIQDEMSHVQVDPDLDEFAQAWPWLYMY